MMMRSPLFQTNALCWILIVLAHCSNSLLVDMSLHSDTSICSYSVMPRALVQSDRDSNPRSTTRQASTVLITLHMLSERTLFLNTFTITSQVLYYCMQNSHILLIYIQSDSMVPRVLWFCVFMCYFNQICHHIFNLTTTVLQYLSKHVLLSQYVQHKHCSIHSQEYPQIVFMGR